MSRMPCSAAVGSPSHRSIKQRDAGRFDCSQKAFTWEQGRMKALVDVVALGVAVIGVAVMAMVGSAPASAGPGGSASGTGQGWGQGLGWGST